MRKTEVKNNVKEIIKEIRAFEESHDLEVAQDDIANILSLIEDVLAEADNMDLLDAVENNIDTHNINIELIGKKMQNMIDLESILDNFSSFLEEFEYYINEKETKARAEMEEQYYHELNDLHERLRSLFDGNEDCESFQEVKEILDEIACDMERLIEG